MQAVGQKPADRVTKKKFDNNPQARMDGAQKKRKEKKKGARKLIQSLNKLEMKIVNASELQVVHDLCFYS